MTRSALRQFRKLSHGRGLPLAAAALVILAASSVSAQLAPNQTNGFGNDRLVTFTYLQNFDCVDQPTLDLDFNRIKAQSDPIEMQTPICQQSPSRHRTQPAATSSTPPTCTCFFQCSRWTRTRIPVTRCRVLTEAGRASFAVPLWETR